MSRIGQGNSVFEREWAAKFVFFYGPGQSVFLRSNHGAMVRRLEGRSKAREQDSDDMFMAAQPWRKEIRKAVKGGASRGSLPWGPLITAAPSNDEIEVPAVVEADQRTKDWDIISDVSAGLRRLAHICPEGPTVIELLFDDAAEDWTSMGLWHGPLYRFDDRAVRLMGKLRRAYADRIQKKRDQAERFAKAMKRVSTYEAPERPTDLKLFVADITAAAQDAAAQNKSTDRLREYQAIEKTGRELAIRISGIWDDLNAGET